MEAIVENAARKGVIMPYDFTEEEFWEEIRKGEEGPFYAIEEAEALLETWKNLRRKK